MRTRRDVRRVNSDSSSQALRAQCLKHQVGWELWPILQMRRLRLRKQGGFPEVTQP